MNWEQFFFALGALGLMAILAAGFFNVSEAVAAGRLWLAAGIFAGMALLVSIVFGLFT